MITEIVLNGLPERDYRNLTNDIFKNLNMIKQIIDGKNFP